MPQTFNSVLRQTRAGFHRAVAGMARAGNDIIMDHVLSEPWRLRDCLAVMAGIDVVFVGVHCSLDALQRRKQQRGDRPLGTATRQIEQVHTHRIYDPEVDTSTNTLKTCSNQIKHSSADAHPIEHSISFARQQTSDP